MQPLRHLVSTTLKNTSQNCNFWKVRASLTALGEPHLQKHTVKSTFFRPPLAARLNISNFGGLLNTILFYFGYSMTSATLGSHVWWGTLAASGRLWPAGSKAHPSPPASQLQGTSQLCKSTEFFRVTLHSEKEILHTPKSATRII